MVGFECAVLVAVLIAVHRTCQEAIQELRTTGLRISLAWTLAGCIVYVFGLMPTALFWHGTLCRLGAAPTVWASIRAYFIGALGKYVQGKITVVAMRAGTICGPQVPLSVATISAVYEGLLRIGAAGLLSAVLLFTLAPDEWLLIFTAVSIALAAGLPTIPWVFARLLRLVRRRTLSDVTEAFSRIGKPWLAVGWASALVGWAIIGTSVFLVAIAAGGSPTELPRSLGLCAAAGSLGVVVGVLSFVPGGVLVREATILGILTIWTDDAVALLATILLRAAWTLSEAAAGFVVWLIRPRSSQAGMQTKFGQELECASGRNGSAIVSSNGDGISVASSNVESQ